MVYKYYLSKNDIPFVVF